MALQDAMLPSSFSIFEEGKSSSSVKDTLFGNSLSEYVKADSVTTKFRIKKVVVKLDLHDDRAKQKAMKAVSSLQGVESIAMNMKEKKLTVIGDVDPIDVVGKLRKLWYAEILTVGPAKEPEKKKDEDKKKKDEEEKRLAELAKAYWAYNPYMAQQQQHYNYSTPHYYVQSAEENPNSCVIC